MTAVYPDLIKYEAYVESAWVDITADVVGGETCKYGIMSNSQKVRVASPGSMTLKMRNDAGCIGGVAGYYNPGFVGALSGWNITTPIRQTITYKTADFIKRWYVTNIDPGEMFGIFAQVKCTDFMQFASIEDITLPAVDFDVDISDAVQAVLAEMTAVPDDTTYGIGITTFDTMFDVTSAVVKPLTEFTKVALSEFGYVYLRREENLVVEGKGTRVIADKISSFVDLEDELLLMEDGSTLLMEDGSALLLDDVIDVKVDNFMTDASVSYGKEINNRVKIKTYPRRVDDDATTTLFNLESVLLIPAGETKLYNANYKDPSNESVKIAGTAMVTPVATTHYLMNANAEGTGADLTADLTVTAYYYAQEVFYDLENTGAVDGYVTFLKAVGKGIYTYNPIEYISDDSTSITAYGKKELSLDLKYQSNPGDIVDFADRLLAQSKDPRIELESFEISANKNMTSMVLFLNLDIGDLIEVVEDTSSVNGYYFIQSISYKLKPGGSIKAKYQVVEALSFGEVFWQLDEVGFSELGDTTYLGY